MQISGNFSVGGLDAARAATKSNAIQSAPPSAQPASSAPVDKLELSAEALGVSNTNAPGEVFRADKVAGLREAIAQGNYDTDERLSAALDNFLDQLG
jgi:anti-sigma28 factor (negative regulator of flagellin synthesis)